MFLLEMSDAAVATLPRVITSPTDLTAAADCEFAFLRKLDEKLGRGATVPEPPNALRDRAGRLGDAHEQQVLARYRQQYGRVIGFERPDVLTQATLETLAADTLEAFRSGADVVFQGAFFDGEFVGYADFIVRRPDGSYRVQDTKLARSAKVPALLQLAAYATRLADEGIRVDDTVELILGTGERSEHRLADIAPVYRNRYHRLRTIVDERVHASERVAWGDPRYIACGRCAACEAEIAETRDLLLVARMRASQRQKFVDAGLTTIDQLAFTPAPPTIDMPDERVQLFQRQARLQVASEGLQAPAFEVWDIAPINGMPVPDEGDIFFDFEGDPLYSEGSASAPRSGSDGTPAPDRNWNLDYLFGVIEAPTDVHPEGRFVPFWAHSFAEERVAFDAFCRYLAARLAAHPGMHVYHYAPYERTHLVSLAARHGMHEQFVDDLLRDHVLVDLYAVVRGSVLIGSRSYSLKKIEPIYLDVGRDSDVKTAGESVEQYWAYQAARDAGDEALAAELLASIAEYNRIDCVSTLQLRDWLIEIGAEHGATPGTLTATDPDPDHAGDESAIIAPLRTLAGEPPDPREPRVARDDRTAEQQLYAMAAAAVDYYRRERTSFWLDHFLRLVMSTDRLFEQRDVFLVDPERSAVLEDWALTSPRQTKPRRRVRLVGQWSPGSSAVTVDSSRPFVYYDRPAPFQNPGADALARSWAEVRYLEVSPDGSELLIEETRNPDADDWDALPMGVGPGWPVQSKNIQAAIERWGAALLTEAPALPKDAVADLIRRIPPRTRSGRAVHGDPATDDDHIPRVTASVLDLDDSYLAVQGPPGTGKTYLAGHVIRELVEQHRWKIGVVAQSHKVVEHVLNCIVDAGLDPAKVGKAPHTEPVRYTALEGQDPQRAFAANNAGTGYVLGGTVWDFANPHRFTRRQLDLLVVDEAGQFALAPTIGAAAAARNLLLLGDPQQLPQVTQGVHPEPIDTSALGWLADGDDVLPAEFGYFLPESRRMSPPLAAAVSDLAYAGQLRSHPVTAGRRLDGITPGVHPEPVLAAGNATSSPQEAQRVAELVRGLIGAPWTDPSSDRVRTPLTQRDFIVVTPYNAQVQLVERALADAGLGDVPVGTVDRFQGQEAVIAIVSLAASSPVEVPRGMAFLIMKNRLNVAISRAQWAAYLVHSPLLTDYLPHRPAEVAELSGFIRLLGR